MDDRKTKLTSSEWYVMECLWDNAPLTGREVTEALEMKIGWNRSTSLTMLKRMTEKGLISCSSGANIKTYSPLICRDDAVERETESFLRRVYHGSLSLMLSSMTEKQELSREEISELYDILRRAQEEQK